MQVELFVLRSRNWKWEIWKVMRRNLSITMQVKSILVRPRNMLTEDALIKSNGIKYTKEYDLPVCVSRELHQWKDFQVVSAVDALCFSYGSNTRRIHHWTVYEDDIWNDGLRVSNSENENTICWTRYAWHFIRIAIGICVLPPRSMFWYCFSNKNKTCINNIREAIREMHVKNLI